MGTLLVGMLLVGVTVLIIRKMILDKKNGKSCHCSGDCGRCGGCKDE